MTDLQHRCIVYSNKKSLFFLSPYIIKGTPFFCPPVPLKIGKISPKKGKIFPKFLIPPRIPGKKSLFFPLPSLANWVECTPMAFSDVVCLRCNIGMMLLHVQPASFYPSLK